MRTDIWKFIELRPLRFFTHSFLYMHIGPVITDQEQYSIILCLTPQLIHRWWQITTVYMDLDSLWYKTPEFQLTLPLMRCRLSTVKTGQKMASLWFYTTLDHLMQKCYQTHSPTHTIHKINENKKHDIYSLRLLLTHLKGRLTLLRTGFVDRTSYIDDKEIFCGNLIFKKKCCPLLNMSLWKFSYKLSSF